MSKSKKATLQCAKIGCSVPAMFIMRLRGSDGDTDYPCCAEHAVDFNRAIEEMGAAKGPPTVTRADNELLH